MAKNKGILLCTLNPDTLTGDIDDVIYWNFIQVKLVLLEFYTVKINFVWLLAAVKSVVRESFGWQNQIGIIYKCQWMALCRVRYRGSMSILKGSIIQNAIFDFINIILRRSSIFVVFLGGKHRPSEAPQAARRCTVTIILIKLKQTKKKIQDFKNQYKIAR